MIQGRITVTPEQNIEGCMALMTDRRTRHLPVVHDGGVSDIISAGDIVKAIVIQQEFMMAQLETYIMGHAPGGA
jgi:CBS domain-containing protein